MALFDTTYELSLNKSYVSHWDTIEAVRELIQNSLDSEAPFMYEFVPCDNGLVTLVLTSTNITLPSSTLLLGGGTKAESTTKIGHFGEGYKIAMLVLTRSGHPVTISNGGVLWVPEFRYNSKYNDDLLVIQERKNPERSKDLSFYVDGLSEDMVHQIRESCLLMQDQIGQVHETTYGQILLDKPGTLYVGNLFVCKTKLKYGYNILPKFIRLERDRQTVDGWDLKAITTNMWFEVKDFDKVAQMIEGEVPDVATAEWSSPPLVKEACYRLFRQSHPQALVATSQSELKAAVESGLTKTVYVGSSFGSIVRSSPQYRAEPREVVKSPHQILTDWYNGAKYHMHHREKVTFESVLAQAKKWA